MNLRKALKATALISLAYATTGLTITKDVQAAPVFSRSLDVRDQTGYPVDPLLGKNDKLYVVGGSAIGEFDKDYKHIKNFGSELNEGRGAMHPDKDKIYVTDAHSSNVLIHSTDGKSTQTSWHGFGSRPRGVFITKDEKLIVSKVFDHKLGIYDMGLNFIRHISGSFYYPGAATEDPEGNILVANYGKHRIDKFNSDGTQHLASFGSFGSENGQFKWPEAISTDHHGNIYVTSPYWKRSMATHRLQIFDKDFNHLFTLGSRGDGFDEFSSPYGIAIDKKGNIYVADADNYRIQFLFWPKLWDEPGTNKFINSIKLSDNLNLHTDYNIEIDDSDLSSTNDINLNGGRVTATSGISSLKTDKNLNVNGDTTFKALNWTTLRIAPQKIVGNRVITIDGGESGTVEFAPISPNFTGKFRVQGAKLRGSANKLKVDIENNSAVEFEQNVDAEYSKAISGSGKLYKTGAGELTLSGTNTYTGETIVYEGGLRLTGEVAGTVSLRSSTILSGRGTIRGDLVTEAGSQVKPGREAYDTKSLHVEGNYIPEEGSILRLNFTTEGSKVIDADILKVGGEAHINGLKLHLIPDPAGEYDFADEFDIIEAGGGVKGKFAKVVPMPGFVYKYTMNYSNPKKVSFSLHKEVGLSSIAKDRNNIQVAKAFKGMKITPDGELEKVMEHFNDHHDDNLEKDLYQLHNERDAKVQEVQAGVFSGVSNKITEQIASVKLQTSPTTASMRSLPESNKHAERLFSDKTSKGFLGFQKGWASTNGGQVQAENSRVWSSFTGTTIRDRESIKGYKSQGGALMFGYDRMLTKNTLLGTIIGYAKSTTDWKNDLGEATLKQSFFGVYGNYSKDKYFINGSAIASWDKYSNVRKINLGSFNTKAHSKHYGYSFNFSAKAGLDLKNSYFTLQPFTSASILQVRAKGSKENGAGELNLIRMGIASSIDGSYQLGVSAYKDFDQEDYKARTILSLGLQHDKKHKASKQQSKLKASNSNMSITGKTKSKSYTNVGAGLEFETKKGWEISSSYSVKFRNKYTSHNLFLNFGKRL